MEGFRKSKGTSYTAFRSAAEEVATKQANYAFAHENRASSDEDRTASPSGRITRVAGADLPYVVVLTPSGDAARQCFATMREAEAFIKRHALSPADGTLSPLYDRPTGD